MKLLFYTSLFLLLTGINAKDKCFELPDGTLYCLELELKPDEPLQLKHSKIVIHISTGSIGEKTFSQMTDLTHLTIENCTIDNIADGALCSPPKLENIVIYANQLFPKLCESLLNNCEKVKYMSVDKMEIEATAFKHMTNIEMLNFFHQTFSHFTKTYLEPLKNLKSLGFFECEFEEIEPGILCLPPKLEHMEFDRNKIPVTAAKDILTNCEKIKAIRLHHNDINWEKESNNLSSKPLRKEWLVNLNHVEKLEIDQSGITSINIDAFENFNNLKDLSLRRNELSEIVPSIWTSLPNLTKLNLRDNKLTSIDTISHPKLEVLDVGDNAISEIDTKTLKANLPKLKELRIAGNPISKPRYIETLEEQLGVTIVNHY